MFVIFSVSVESFFSLSNLGNIFRQGTVLALVALGQLIAILLQGINLAIGSIMGLTSVCIAVFMVNNGIPMIPAVLLGLAIATVAGMIPGALIAYTKMPPFIATFGMDGMAFGVALVLSDERVIWGFDERIRLLHDGSFLGLPGPLIIIVVATLAFFILFRFTPFGIGVFAVGDNETAARLSGIPFNRYKLLGFGLSGLMGGAAGLLMMARINSAQALIGWGYQFDSIAACILGGAALGGGKGKVSNAIVGVAIIASLRNGLNLMGVNVYSQLVIIGVIIILAYIMNVEKIDITRLANWLRSNRGAANSG
jgi:ribose transport system permease protein